MNFLFFNLIFIFSWFISPAMHPIHVSICNIELNNTENTVSIKLFKDDFALALKNNYQVEVQMEKADDNNNSQIISKYVNSFLQIKFSNNKIMDLDYKYSELNEDAIWIHFRAEKIFQATNLRIKNTLMLDLWDDQTNLLIISFNGKEKGYRFNRKEVEIEIDLNH